MHDAPSISGASSEKVGCDRFIALVVHRFLNAYGPRWAGQSRLCAYGPEFDGKEKYGKLLESGQTAADAVFEEKRREAALRDLGSQIVRWIWQDLHHPEKLRRRLERAFERASEPPNWAHAPRSHSTPHL
jgi:hypothetical protein